MSKRKLQVEENGSEDRKELERKHDLRFCLGMSTQHCHVFFMESEWILFFLGPNWPIVSPSE